MDLKFKDNSQLKLSHFTQLEYIESTGTQWIDSGFKATGGDRQIYTYAITSAPTNWGCIVGSEDASSPYNRNTIALKSDLTTWEAGYGTGYTNVSYVVSLNSIHTNEVKISSNEVYFKIDSTTLFTHSGVAINPTTNVSIFRFQKGVYPICARLYSLKLYNASDILVRDFLPAKDYFGVVCLYDTVSHTFFYNQGTGNFVAGPVVKQALPETILLKTTTLYHKNTPNIDGLQLLNGILNVQETAEDIVLNRIRVDIGNVSGSVTELLQYAGMAGFNDNYEPQTKPRLVGTFTINDYYIPAQLAQAQAAFDGLTVVGDPNYVLDFTQMAVQTLDSTQPNYNPAVAIILQGQNIGTTMSVAPLGHGRWFLTKTQAAAITRFGVGSDGWFYNKTTVTDVNSIVTSNSSQTYDFSNFDQFQYFTGVSIIYSFCFLSCTKLNNIILPQTVTSIETRAFFNVGTSSLEEGEGFTLNLPLLTQLSQGQEFLNCKSLKNIQDLGSITTIGNETFSGTSNLKSCNLPNTVTTIGTSTFASSAIETINWPTSLVSIGDGAFHYCSSLKIPTFPQTVTTIGKHVFRYASTSGITSDDLIDVDLPNLTSFGQQAFQNCQCIKSVIDLGSITTIGNETFESTSNLKSCNLPNTVTTIATNAFASSAIETINWPTSLVSIGDGAFHGCSSLKIPTFPQTVTTIGNHVFRYASTSKITSDDLIDVDLPNLTALGQQAFQNCQCIKSVIDLGSITTIGNETFESTSNLNIIVLPATLTGLGYNRGLKSTCIIHILASTPPSVGANNYITPTTVKIYVGDGSSAASDDVILQAYLADTNWSTYSSRLDTWYNYLHPAA